MANIKTTLAQRRVFAGVNSTVACLVFQYYMDNYNILFELRI